MRPGWPWRACALAAAGAAMLAAFVPRVPATAQGARLESAIKAAYLSKFGDFVQWPPSAFASPDSAVNLCVIGDAPPDDGLTAAVTGRHVGHRPIVVRRLDSVAGASSCHILYVAGSNGDLVARVLNTVRGASVLTVTDAPSPGTPSIISFVIKDDHVRFDIDAGAAAQNGIVISSKLLSLALSVTSRK